MMLKKYFCIARVYLRAGGGRPVIATSPYMPLFLKKFRFWQKENGRLIT